MNSSRPHLRRPSRSGLLALGLAVDLLWRIPGLAAPPSESLPPLGQATPSVRFEELPAAETGIEFANHWKAPRAYERALSLSFAAGGVAIGDYDADGLPDLYLSRPFDGGRLFRNLGGFRFEDVTVAAGLGGDEFWQASPSFVDIDGDGDLDLYVCAFNAPNRLYINRGGRFTESANEAGLDFHGFSINMAFADYDLDGDMDGYLVTNRPFSPEESYDVADRALAQRVFRQLERDDAGKFSMPEHLREIFDIMWNPVGQMDMFIRAGQYDHLYRNDGPAQEAGVPKFTDVTREAGLLDNGMGLSATWWDYDGDRRPDLYVANDYYGADHLYHNAGDGTFTDVTLEALPHTPWYSMGTNVADLNNDGLLDFMGSDMIGTNHFRQKVGMGNMSQSAWFLDTAEPRQYMRNAVYINTGTGRFMEAAHMTGLAKSDWTWALKFGDLDNDGNVDLFIANGMTGDFFNSDITAARRAGTYLDPAEDEARPEPKRDANLAFRNLGELEFQNVSESWGLGKEAASFGAALGDLDGDGDLDLVVNNFADPVSIYRNASGNENHRVKFRLVGEASNRFGVGATLRLWSGDGQVRTRHLTLSRGFYASDEPIVHFGLGAADTIERLTIDWPGGATQTFAGLAADRFYTITEPEETEPVKPSGEGPLYREIHGIGGAHIELNFDDFRRQPLLPQKYSQLGPGAAWGDVDGDGDEDLFTGQGHGTEGRLYFNEGGKFVLRSFSPFDADKACEDMAPVIFDADGDGDRDLYVVSGGVELEPGDPALQDRLYLNDGAGKFTKAPPEALPRLLDSGGVACAADYDRDGDVDLFVGGRIIPGRFPETPASQLLQNDGRGHFKAVAPDDLRTTGLVTSALWSDVDADGWIDLLVTHEWGPVKVFRNLEGELTDATAGSGIGEITGWWNSIAAADIDLDGDMDYAVGNVGLNSKYHASADHPVLLYYGDFEGGGRPHIIEAEFEGPTLYPVRGRSCSSQAIPTLKEKFPTYKSFASAALSEIYGDSKLAQAQKLSANTLESGVLINVTGPDGTPRFEFRPLPRLAQISPVFGIAFTEIDGDGRPDLYVVQNSFAPQRETGRMNGGVSLLLMNGPDGFEALPPRASGLIVPGDASSLTVSDLNADGLPDFHVGINDGRPTAFVADGSRHSDPASIIAIQLRGGPGNPDAIGARVRINGADSKPRTQQVSAGGGYLSQSSPILFFGVGHGPGDRPKSIEVTWPDGGLTTHQLDDLERRGGRYWLSR